MTQPDKPQLNIISSRHPLFKQSWVDFDLWRKTYEAGEDYVDRYLKKFSARESTADYNLRRDVTPVPSFAASAVDEVKNSIFQRLPDVTRTNGSESYHKAMNGESGGVDRRGNSMNAFLGLDVLTDLLVMQFVGVYVDNSAESSPTLSGPQATPYLYRYAREDILNWKMAGPDQPSEFQSVLLRDNVMEYHEVSGLPVSTFERFRMVWIGEDGKVRVQFLDAEGNLEGEERVLNLERIPFVLFDIKDSLIRRVCKHQIALLNLVSSDVNFGMLSNFPFYTEQRDFRKGSPHLKRPSQDGEGEAGQPDTTQDVQVGATHGRAYVIGAERPSFIAPPDHTLRASMDLQDKLERQIRELVHLSVKQLGQQSAESKDKDQDGLESGLSFIGLVLQTGENKIAEHWAAYENRVISKRKIARVKYPDTYEKKTLQTRIQEANGISDLMQKIPSRSARVELSKIVVANMFSDRISTDMLEGMKQEIEDSPFLTADPDTILAAVEKGLCGDKTGSIALGFGEDEHEVAQEDHLKRIERIRQAQSPASEGDPDSRGVDDLSADPDAAKKEKQISQDPTIQEDRKSATRGEEN